MEEYFQKNPNSSIRKAAQVRDLNRETLRLILKNVLKLHSFQISTHRMLTQAAMAKRVEFSKQMF